MLRRPLAISMKISEADSTPKHGSIPSTLEFCGAADSGSATNVNSIGNPEKPGNRLRGVSITNRGENGPTYFCERSGKTPKNVSKINLTPLSGYEPVLIGGLEMGKYLMPRTPLAGERSAEEIRQIAADRKYQAAVDCDARCYP